MLQCIRDADILTVEVELTRLRASIGGLDAMSLHKSALSLRSSNIRTVATAVRPMSCRPNDFTYKSQDFIACHVLHDSDR